MLLQNDSFTDGQSAGFQSGFVAGEEGAVTLGPVAEAFTIDKVRFLFGGATSTHSITLRIYAGSGVANPGAQLFSGDYQATGADNGIQEIDLTGENIMLNGGSFRVSIGFQHSGAPSIARDLDGIVANRNWIFAGQAGWFEAGQLGIAGDWIIRAEINTVGGGSGGAGGTTNGSGGASSTGGGSSSGGAGGMSSGSGTPATSGGQVCTPGQSVSCVGPGACAGGQVCEADGMSFGACACGDTAEPLDDGCSCSVAGTDDDDGGVPLLASLGLLGLATLRRRRSR